MRKIIIAIALCVPVQAAFCQQDSLLKKFKYRINRYQALNANLAGGGEYYQTKPLSGTNTNTSSSGGLGVNYYTQKSTDKMLFTWLAGFSANFGSYKSTSQNITNRNKSFSVTPYTTVLNKWFSKNKFIELGVDMNGNFNGSKTEATNDPAPAKYQESQYTVAINTGIGMGRLENVTDMQNALWLNKALEASSSLSRPLSAEELNELGQSITKGNNTRVLDSRKRIQYTLETVDAYLQKKGLIKKTDIAYFSNLNDILFYAFNSPRLSGTEKFIRFTPAINAWDNNQHQSNGTDKYEYHFDVKSLTLSSGFSRYIPTSLTHQNNYGASVKLSYGYTDLENRFLTNGTLVNEAKGNSDLKKAGLNLFYQHAIYPNTRTTINFDLRGDVGYEDLNQSTGIYGNGNLNIGLNYFISYRTRFTVNLGTDYQKNDYSFDQQGLYMQAEAFRLYANVGVQIGL